VAKFQVKLGVFLTGRNYIGLHGVTRTDFLDILNVHRKMCSRKWASN